jgi:hypothetical protein
MKFPPVTVLGVGMWQVGFPSAKAWLAGIPDNTAQKPASNALDRVNRRRAGPLCRSLADAAAEAMQMAAVDPSLVPTIVGSAIGEAATMIGLLDQMWRRHEPMSPAEFTVSVHNAASGLISICNKNRGMTTSLAADSDTPAAALMEGIGMVLTHGGPVCVACGDEPAPENLAGQAPPWSMLASAIVIGPADHTPNLGELVVTEGLAATRRGEGFDALAIANPEIGLAWLVDAVLRGHSGVVALDAGHGRGYVADLHCAPR